MPILSSKLGITANGVLRSFHQQHAHHPIALLGDRAQLRTSARVMTIADEVDWQLAQAMRSYMGAGAGAPSRARA
jgi:hypothetical protein